MILFKIIVLGDAAVGKSSLMNNYMGNPFSENESPTIGVEFGSKIVDGSQVLSSDLKQQFFEAELQQKKKSNNNSTMHQQDIPLKTMIWNTSGQERFHSIVTSYYRKTNGVLLVCDVTRKETLTHLDYWIQDYNKNSAIPLSEVGAVIVANKSDLKDRIEIQPEELQKFAEQHEIPYFVVSSKVDREKVTLIFNNLMNQMFENHLKNPIINELDDTVDLNKSKKTKSPIFSFFQNWCTIF